MSLVAFVVGAILMYFLYSSHEEAIENSKKNEICSRRTSLDITENETDGIKRRVNLFFKSLSAFQQGLNSSNGYVNKYMRDPFIFRSFMDRFQSFDDISKAMHDFGLGDFHLIIGIDFTESNMWQGKITNNGNPLHQISRTSTNQYQRIIKILGHTIEDFMELGNNHLVAYKSKKKYEIPSFGFGDTTTKDSSVFSLRTDGSPCDSFSDLLENYRKTVSSVILSGPTSFAPIINKSVEIVRKTHNYHLLVIMADGQFVDSRPTSKAIVEASKYPLSIVVVGVGDGPWDTLYQFDDWLPQRKFDNFQFVEYAQVLKQCGSSRNFETALALHIFMEVPDQYKAVCDLGYLTPNAKEVTKSC